jgi:hypothetical protein
LYVLLGSFLRYANSSPDFVERGLADEWVSGAVGKIVYIALEESAFR